MYQGLLVKANMMLGQSEVFQGLKINIEIQLHIIIFFGYYMMIAVSDIREVEWFEGKSPEVFVLNSGDVYIHTANSSMTTLTYHATSACIHYNSLWFHLTLKVPLPAILPSKSYKLKSTIWVWHFLSQLGQREMTVK